MQQLFKYVLIFLAAYLIFRFIVRKLFTVNVQRPAERRNDVNTNTESLEKPRFTIEAEEVDYEIIESEEKDEKK